LKPQVSPDVTDLEVETDQPVVRKKPRHRQWGGAATGLLAGFLALVLGRAGHLWPAFDVAAQFGAQALSLVIGFSIAALFPRYKALIGIVLTISLVFAYGIWPLLVSQKPNVGPFTLQPGERTVRLMQYNTWERNRDFAATVAEIKRLDPDIVALEEFDPGKREILFRLRIDYPYQYACHELPQCHIAILSRFPILATAADSGFYGLPFASVKLGGAMSGYTVVSTHTTRFPHSRAQLAQANELVKHLEKETDRLIVMGDFNATPFSRIPGVIQTGTGLNRLTSLPSWPAWSGIPQLAIDHVFVSPEIRQLANEQIGNAAGSDHFPIIVTVAIPH
jgi:endonuclease/exonuclease/phosphatase (EEP) superfamily protein YafD